MGLFLLELFYSYFCSYDLILDPIFSANWENNFWNTDELRVTTGEVSSVRIYITKKKIKKEWLWDTGLQGFEKNKAIILKSIIGMSCNGF